MICAPDKHPLKWVKYLVLVHFGFITIEELEQEVKRYRRSESALAIRDITRHLRLDRKQGHRNLYVVKLVSPSLPGRLPNFRVERRSDIDGLLDFFAKHEGDHTEIWFCGTRIDRSVFSVAGRFLFTHKHSHRLQSVEQVWRCSPRMLEYYSDNFPYPYLRGSRCSWGWHYDFDHVHLPPRSGMSRSELLQDFRSSMRLFERLREPLEMFLSFLDSFGFPAYSLEYKIVGSRLTIIDWDTPNDRLVATACTETFRVPRIAYRSRRV